MNELIFIGTIACCALLMIFLYIRTSIYNKRIKNLVSHTKYLNTNPNVLKEEACITRI